MRTLLQLTRPALRLWRQQGTAELWRRARGQLHRQLQQREYQRWLHRCEGPALAAALRAEWVAPARPLLLSVIMPVYNVEPRWLRQAIDSVLAQSYPHLQLCIADDASPRPELAPLLREYARRDGRIRLTLRPRNGHIAAASNSALELASGEFVCLLDHDDQLAPCALELVARELARFPQADLLYSDEDKIDARGRRFEPSFKSELNYDLLLSQNQLSHLGVYRTSLVRAVGGFRQGLEGSQDYDLALRVLERTTASRVRHIPHILYHWRSIPGSTALAAGEKPYAHSAARQAVAEHLQRRGVAAQVLPAYNDWHRVQYALPDPPPLVSLILTAPPRADSLAALLAELRERTDYRPLELLLPEPTAPRGADLLARPQARGGPGLVWRQVAAAGEPGGAAQLNRTADATHGSVLLREPGLVLRQVAAAGEPGGAAQLNRAAEAAHGSVLVFLDPELGGLDPGWLRELVSHALRPAIGAVGGKLLYADGRIEQAGLILGLGGQLAGRSQHGAARGAGGYLGRAQLLQQCTAMSAACLALRAEVFAAAGGFDAANLPQDYGAVDLCLRLRELGLGILYTPYAELRYRHRRPPPAEPSAAAAAYLRRRWGAALRADPFYSPNLSLSGRPFTLAFPPRTQGPQGGECVAWSDPPPASGLARPGAPES